MSFVLHTDIGFCTMEMSIIPSSHAMGFIHECFELCKSSGFPDDQLRELQALVPAGVVGGVRTCINFWRNATQQSTLTDTPTR